MNNTQEVSGRSDVGRGLAVLVPPVDVIEDESGITVNADMPGVTKENVTIRVEGGTLTIDAPLTLGESTNLSSVYSETRSAHYRRTFTLSHELDTTKIVAAIKDGVLKLHVPKAEDAKPRRIEVRAA